MKKTEEILDKILIETQLKNELIERQIILENVYEYDVFEKILKFCKSNLLFSDKEFILLNYSNLIDLFPKKLKFLKYLNKNKSVYVICSHKFNNQQKQNLSLDEIDELNTHIKSTNGYILQVILIMINSIQLF